ncbi:alkyl hydroperoxide reductase/ Thiol specific antioxidant/ Mal allergen [Chthoniobacter flavus Ellin428]|uniref:Alkyl hydroperoxide reductase/ Thiol specific antioxidant/ Mal allergen n=1 Tax=Chthoniobacter flavus Ellin428 TaxID=497964 RepID=B4D8Y5_9BACT|nr:peroxiredoxin family protein [Chthoniobacter flavus]EDY17030.1 alkyl hydroperoxide reductase/ Thiol specific antioxidant/ Mal allergen [Chthoniobacter flavus Ellin428]TCO86203.1 peroxiredoxin [Chthoniobacter flavus]
MNSLLRLLLLACSFSLLARAEEPPAKADDKAIPGHSSNGEAFNEGPRQAAVLMEGTGNVNFPVTTENALAQKFFAQGVGQLHGFWYFEAERSFRQVAFLDPECAMAYWGMAMANINTPKRAADFMKLAVAKKAKASHHEQLWIDAYSKFFADSNADENRRRNALVHALEDVTYEFPDDLEAKAFLVFQLWDNKQHGLPLPSRLAVDALAKEVLAVNPMHPIHHYLIHLWNGADGDKRAVAAAAHCGQSAPAIAHMWHMSGHTFSNLHRYADAAWQQEASARIDHAYMATARIMPEQIHNYAHNNDWLVKNLTYIGRVHDAIDLAKNMIELPRLGPNQSNAYDMGRERLLSTLATYELWDDLIALRDTLYLAPAENPVNETKQLTAFGIAYFQRGDTTHGEEMITALQNQLKKAREERIKAADTAEAKAQADKKSDDQIAKAMADAMRGFAYRLSTAEAAIAEVQLYRALATGRTGEAKPLLAKARDIPSERRARVLFALGDKEGALKMASEASNADTAQVQPLANLAELQWQAKEPDTARATFEKLRKLSSNIDLDMPIFGRLSPIVADLKLPADWRTPMIAANDVGVRPDIKTLGPFRWHPYAAPAWNLPDAHDAMQSLAAYRGRPVLAVFYLGSGCSRCLEQLNVLAPLTQDFSAAGISIVAISRDSPDGLQRTFEKSKDANGFPFPILSDATLEAFKAYRAYDDFEKMPLHGLYLIDGNGQVRWQNISFQPFSDAKWLLGEAKRLLSVPASETKTAAN